MRWKVPKDSTALCDVCTAKLTRGPKNRERGGGATRTKSHLSTSIAMNELRSAHRRYHRGRPEWAEARRHACARPPQASPAGLPDQQCASMLSTAAAITNARESTQPVCAGGGAGCSMMYTGTVSPPSPLAAGSCVPLKKRGRAPCGCSAACGLYALSVQMSSGRQMNSSVRRVKYK